MAWGWGWREGHERKDACSWQPNLTVDTSTQGAGSPFSEKEELGLEIHSETSPVGLLSFSSQFSFGVVRKGKGD